MSGTLAPELGLPALDHALVGAVGAGGQAVAGHIAQQAGIHGAVGAREVRRKTGRVVATSCTVRVKLMRSGSTRG